MKKYLNLVLTALASVLTFVFFALPFMGVEGFSVSGYDAITFEGNAVLTIYAICAIVLLVAAGLTFVVCVLQLLKQLNVLKVNFDLNKVLKIATLVLAVLAVVCLVMNIVYVLDAKYIAIGVALILTAFVHVAAAVCRLVVKED